jgi:hypothetical protein
MLNPVVATLKSTHLTELRPEPLIIARGKQIY